MWGFQQDRPSAGEAGERMPFSSGARRDGGVPSTATPSSPHQHGRGRRGAHGSVSGPVRRRFAPVITAASLAALTGLGVVHTVGLEPVGRSGSSGAAAEAALADSLQRSVTFQCADVGRRSSRYSPRQEVFERYLRGALLDAGLKLVEQAYTVGSISGRNFIGVLPGRGPGAILVGAHFDSLGKSPCANASASAVAAVEGVARELRGETFERTVLFALFDNGERPNHGEPTAGVAAWLEDFSSGDRRRELLPLGGELELALLVSSFGSWSDLKGSHVVNFPWSLAVPDVADWVAIHGGLGERSATTDLLASWGRQTDLPARGFALPSWAPGVPLADEAPFRDASIPALVISDSGQQRMPEIRTAADIPQVLNFGAMAQRVRALSSVVAEQADL